MVIGPARSVRRRFALLRPRRSFSGVASWSPDRAASPRAPAPTQGERHVSGSRLGRRMSGRIVVSAAVGSKTSMSGRECDDVSHPHERRKAHGLLRATSRRVVSGMLIARDEKTHSNNCGPRSDQPRSSSQMYRFVQIEKPAPAPLTSVRSLKCSQSQLMPQMRFVQAAIPQFFRPTDQMW